MKAHCSSHLHILNYDWHWVLLYKLINRQDKKKTFAINSGTKRIMPLRWWWTGRRLALVYCQKPCWNCLHLTEHFKLRVYVIHWFWPEIMERNNSFSFIGRHPHPKFQIFQQHTAKYNGLQRTATQCVRTRNIWKTEDIRYQQIESKHQLHLACS